MKKSEKIIALFYVFLTISFTISVIFITDSFGELKSLSIFPEPVTEIEFKKTVNVETVRFFDLVSSIEKYPIILPQNVVSVKIIEQNDNFIIAEEEFIELGIKTKFLVKHTIIPYEKQIIEVLEGYAKDTIIEIQFDKIESGTILNIKGKINFEGILKPFLFIPKQNFIHAINTIIDNFVLYDKTYDNKFEYMVDNLYRKILLRPADDTGIKFYSAKLEQGLITEDELEKILLNSDEFKNLMLTKSLKSYDELQPETKKIINDIYLEILKRPADVPGMIYFASLYESDKSNLEQIKHKIYNSEEAIKIRLNTAERIIINDVINELFSRDATEAELIYYEELKDKSDVNVMEEGDFRILILTDIKNKTDG